MVDLVENDTTSSSRQARKRWPRVLAVVAGLILLVAGGLAIVTLTQETELMDQSVSAEGVSSLVVSGEAGDVTITEEDRPDIRVASVLVTNPWSDAEVDVQAADGLVTVRSFCEGLLGFSSCTVQHDIYVPTGFLDELSVDIAAGDVDIVGSSADLDVQVSAGDVQILQFAGSSAMVRLSAGEVTVAAVAAPASIDVRTSAGGIEIVVPDEVYDVSTDVAAGSVSVALRQDPASERTISAVTSAGDITITAR